MITLRCPACTETTEVHATTGTYRCPHCQYLIVVSGEHGRSGTAEGPRSSPSFLFISGRVLGISLAIMFGSFFLAFATTDPWSGDSVPVVGTLSVVVFYLSALASAVAVCIFVVALVYQSLSMLANR